MNYARLVDGAVDAVADALAGKVAGIAVSTSGSTGEPGEVLLSGKALHASIRGTVIALGGEGHWLLALPIDRIAGAMVLARSNIAQSKLTGVAPGSFTPEAFANAAERLPGDGPHFTSLVPTQLLRLLDSEIGRQALATFDKVLVGGAALIHPHVPGNVVRTYGLTETAGGCVYDGHPIGDTAVSIREDGRILLSGSSLADDYLPARPDAWHEQDGKRWLVTSDLGELGQDGRLKVNGRVDDVINTGGFKVHPRTVEEALVLVDWVHEAAVIGVADQQWGQHIVAFVVPRALGEIKRLWELRQALDPLLPKHAQPAELIVVESLPRLPGGKVSYGALRRTALEMARKNS